MVGEKYAIGISSSTAGHDLVLKAKNIANCDVVNSTISFMTLKKNDCFKSARVFLTYPYIGDYIDR
tara:strand:- start:298 stop:495 length:198 start_codon:yes stop_codon:yes gene_type:complete